MFLGEAHRERGLGGELCGEGTCGGEKTVIRKNAVGEADAHRLPALDALAEKCQFAGLGESDQTRQQPGDPAAEKVADAHLGQADLRAFRHQQEVGGERHFRAGTERIAVDSRHDGLFEAQQTFADLLLTQQVLPALESAATSLVFLEIGPDAEGAALAGEQHHAYGTVGDRRGQGVVQFVVKLLDDGIQSVRAVEANLRDAALSRVKNSFVAHHVDGYAGASFWRRRCNQTIKPRRARVGT